MEKIIVNTKAQLDELEKDSALTWVGLIATDQSLNQAFTWLRGFTKIKNERAFIISGSLMNMAYGLSGDNAYQEDLTIVSVKLSDLENPAAIVIPRLTVGGRWFDDIVANDLRTEAEKRG